jgi:hypothetical protein
MVTFFLRENKILLLKMLKKERKRFLTFLSFLINSLDKHHRLFFGDFKFERKQDIVENGVKIGIK